MQKFLASLAASFVLAGCSLSNPAAEPLAQADFSRLVAESMCDAVQSINSAGKLQDPNLGQLLDSELSRQLRARKVTEAVFDASREKYYPGEEYDKLLKLTFTTCLVPLG